jgi:hypothetical protein
MTAGGAGRDVGGGWGGRTQIVGAEGGGRWVGPCLAAPGRTVQAVSLSDEGRWLGILGFELSTPPRPHPSAAAAAHVESVFLSV